MQLFSVTISTRSDFLVEAPDSAAAAEHVKAMISANPKHCRGFHVDITPEDSYYHKNFKSKKYDDREIAHKEPVIDAT